MEEMFFHHPAHVAPLGEGLSVASCQGPTPARHCGHSVASLEHLRQAENTTALPGVGFSVAPRRAVDSDGRNASPWWWLSIPGVI